MRFREAPFVFQGISRSAAHDYNGSSMAPAAFPGKVLVGRIASMAFLCFKGPKTPPGEARGASLDDVLPVAA